MRYSPLVLTLTPLSGACAAPPAPEPPPVPEPPAAPVAEVEWVDAADTLRLERDLHAPVQTDRLLYRVAEHGMRGGGAYRDRVTTLPISFSVQNLTDESLWLHTCGTESVHHERGSVAFSVDRRADGEWEPAWGSTCFNIRIPIDELRPREVVSHESFILLWGTRDVIQPVEGGEWYRLRVRRAYRFVGRGDPRDDLIRQNPEDWEPINDELYSNPFVIVP